MNSKTQCVILRKIPYQESSLIVQTFSRDFGRLDLILKGSRGISAKHFPTAELFRLFQVEFREGRGSRDLFHPSLFELSASFDEIAFHIKSYVAMCEFASFLLKHTAQALALPETFDALLVLLQRLSHTDEPGFAVAAAKLAFLNESGLLPEKPGGMQESRTLEDIISYAKKAESPKPELSAEYEKRLISWTAALCRFHGLV